MNVRVVHPAVGLEMFDCQRHHGVEQVPPVPVTTVDVVPSVLRYRLGVLTD